MKTAQIAVRAEPQLIELLERVASEMAERPAWQGGGVKPTQAQIVRAGLEMGLRMQLAIMRDNRLSPLESRKLRRLESELRAWIVENDLHMGDDWATEDPYFCSAIEWAARGEDALNDAELVITSEAELYTVMTEDREDRRKGFTAICERHGFRWKLHRTGIGLFRGAAEPPNAAASKARRRK